MVFLFMYYAYYITYPEAWFLLLTTSRWLAVYLDVICAIFVTVVAFGALILVESKYRCAYLWYIYGL